MTIVFQDLNCMAQIFTQRWTMLTWTPLTGSRRWTISTPILYVYRLTALASWLHWLEPLDGPVDAGGSPAAVASGLDWLTLLDGLEELYAKMDFVTFLNLKMSLKMSLNLKMTDLVDLEPWDVSFSFQDMSQLYLSCICSKMLFSKHRVPWYTMQQCWLLLVIFRLSLYLINISVSQGPL